MKHQGAIVVQPIGWWCMNSTKRTIYLLVPVALVAALMVTACERPSRAMGRRAQATITRTWPASEIRKLQIFEVNGTISIEAAPVDEVSLDATVRGDFDRKRGAENEGLFETTLDGDVLRIRRQDHDHGLFRIPFLFGGDHVEVNYVLRVPPTVSVDVGTVNGRIVTRGIEGETKASSVNGTIDVESVGENAVSATTVNGRLRARFLRSFQGATFKSVNGSVQATLPQTASFTINLSQVNGDFESSFPLSIHSNPGSRRVSGEVNGGAHELKIVTVNGHVELDSI
jgi:Toastrack DUF4097